MASHAEQHPSHDSLDEKVKFEGASKVYSIALVIGLIGLGVMIALGASAGDGFRKFFFSYLLNFSYFLTISLGGLFFVLVQHVVRAGWSVNVRRVAESIAASSTVLAVLALPVIASVAMSDGKLYFWAQHFDHAEGGHAATAAAHGKTADPHSKDAHSTEAKSLESPAGESKAVAETAALKAADHGAPKLGEDGHDPLVEKAHHAALGIESALSTNETQKELREEFTGRKQPWLSSWFFTARLITYFAFWIIVGLLYYRLSVKQDTTGDVELTNRMQFHAGWLIVCYAMSVIFGFFDLLMSLDPMWFSSMFPINLFASCAISIFSTITIILFFLQKSGYLGKSVSKEHYHDLGKFMFAFTFFWGYTAFSQYMLLWYANMPETIMWFARRGATSDVNSLHAVSGWTTIILMILFGHLLIPFAGLLSRHVKRNKNLLVLWAFWLMAFHWLNLFWIIMPEYSDKVSLGLIDFAGLIGIGGIYVAAVTKFLSNSTLRPVRDPRVFESIALENTY